MFFRTKRKKMIRAIAFFLLLNLVLEIFYPGVAYALTGGPSQPEVESFSPVGTSEMVDLATGDFTYNIPLLDVGGYPINLTYNAGITPDQEASWVGIGWNINPGVINRNVRGLPDDFKGDKVVRDFNMKANETYGGKIGGKIEFIGIDKIGKGGLSIAQGVQYNNYTGYSADFSVSPSFAVGKTSGPAFNASLGLSASSQSGADITPGASFSYSQELQKNRNMDLSVSVGVNVNSRAGLSALTVNPSVRVFKKKRTILTAEDGKGYTSQGGVGYNFGSTISMVAPTYTPYSELSYVTKSFSFSGSLGLEAKYLHPGVTLSGHYSAQQLASNQVVSDAYGYMYAQDGRSRTSLHDFNREKDGPVQNTTPYIGLANHTYDLFSLSGQGIGGMFRMHRKEIGMLYNPFVVNGYARSNDFGVELGVGLYVKLGTDFRRVKNTSYTGGWFDGNDLYNKTFFRHASYMKAAGERTAEKNMDYFQAIGGFEAVRPMITPLGDRPSGVSRLVNQQNQVTTVNEDTRQLQQQPVTQNLLTLTAEEASKYGLYKKIPNYALNTFLRTSLNTDYSHQTLLDYRHATEPHHLAEIVSVRPDGARYVYNIPAYNTKQKEVTFSTGGFHAPNYHTGLVQYTPQTNDNTAANRNGQEHYYEGITTPAYAHSYLLTAILSPDYVDRTGDGPTDDDNGSYTRINYSRAVDEFHWRTPVQQNTASHNEGFKSNRYNYQEKSDDKANYVYGTKELWYVHSIETRTHVAEFTLADRVDGLGVIGENGGVQSDLSKSPKQLVKISLYAKPQKSKTSFVSKWSNLPIKEVHFVYDHSVCQGVPNNIGAKGNMKSVVSNTGGKLTLKEVYFTYGVSGKGKYSSYKFHYAGTRKITEGENPEIAALNVYNLKSYDRWGNFKPNTAGVNDSRTTLTAAEFPYVDQQKEKSDIYATLWNLTRIELPSGGMIDVEYEADDYAYVQNKHAMQMFKVRGVVANQESTLNTEIPMDKISSQNRLINSNNTPNNIVVFELAEPIVASDASSAKNILRRDYLKNLDYMYFRFFVRLGSGNDDDTYEFVPGYVKYTKYGMMATSLQENGNNKYTHAWVQMKDVGVKIDASGDPTSPVSRAAWQFAQLYIPEIAYSSKGRPTGSAFKQILEALVDVGGAIQEALQGVNKKMRSENKGIFFEPAKSWIRLYNPNGQKIGGGHRVKRIELSDRWKALSGQSQAADGVYGQMYDYTKQEMYEDGTVKQISSGVASYEPLLGGDENPFRQPVMYNSEDRFLAPRRDYYMEHPFGESFFPGASVVYSKVTVRSIKEGTGYVEHEHYTAKDFPTQVSNTYLDANSRIRQKPSTLAKLLKVKNYDNLTISQGYSIVLNDMHGKSRSQKIYSHSRTLLSGVEYRYQQKNVPVTHRAGLKSHTLYANRLDNEIDVVYKKSTGGGRIAKALAGIDYDIMYDTRESHNQLNTSTSNINVDVSPPAEAPPVPVPIPIAILGFQKEKTTFRTAAITKVINQYGILEETIAYEDGAQVSTKNLLYDAETGDVLLTRTTNQFGDPIYSFTYPAHWGYDRMGPSYRNTGFSTNNLHADAAMFVVGDELGVISQGVARRAWVTGVSAGQVHVQDEYSKPIEGISYAKVIRSGRRNMQTIPIGTVVSLTNPVVGNDLVFTDVINAGAVEFSDTWKVFCEQLNGDMLYDRMNYFLKGATGNWRMMRSFVYLTERTQSDEKRNTNIRKDGVFKSFSPFWKAPDRNVAGDWTPDTLNWQYTSKVTMYSPLGYELENKDALSRFSAALYGYLGGALPIAVSNNAQYRDIAFENFEDRFSYISQMRAIHLRIKPGYGFGESGNLNERIFHSGKVGLEVDRGKMFIFENIIKCP
jgi:hypothetical protein